MDKRLESRSSPPSRDGSLSSRRSSTAANSCDKDGSSGAEFNPLLPQDFRLWKLAPPVLGLLGLGVYLGYRKQVRTERLQQDQSVTTRSRLSFPLDFFKLGLFGKVVSRSVLVTIRYMQTVR